MELISKNKNFDEKIFVEQISKLRNYIFINENEIKEIKRSQICLFKTRYDILKQTGEFALENEIIYSSLFGNGINYWDYNLLYLI